MASSKNIITDKSIDQLKQEYNLLVLGAMIYDTDTENERKLIADEIVRREVNVLHNGTS